MPVCPLTPPQLRCLELLAQGMTYKQIAAKRHIAVSTVRTHIHAAYVRLGAFDKMSAVLAARRKGWLVIPGDDAPETAVMMMRLAAATEHLATAIERSQPLSGKQQTYCDAFTRLLHARHPYETAIAERDLGQALNVLLPLGRLVDRDDRRGPQHHQDSTIRVLVDIATTRPA